MARAFQPEAKVSDKNVQPTNGLPSLPNFAPKAKRVIYLLQNGAPTHVDLFDYKPRLRAEMGKEIPESVTGGQRLTTMTAGQESEAAAAQRQRVRAARAERRVGAQHAGLGARADRLEQRAAAPP